MKPIRGSASIAISKVQDQETVDLLFEHADDLMIQEYLKGQEIGADCYIDMISGELISVFTKKKLVMRAGETDKSISFKDTELFALIERFVKEAGFRGQIDIDIFECDGKYYISEVNPRFGGGYPHAYEAGANHMKYIVNNLQGKVNEPQIGEYESGVIMMKYSEIMIRREIYTGGATNIFRYPELSENGKASELIQTLEEKQNLVDLVTDTLNKDEKGIQVYIGNETPVKSMKDCSVVTATYELGEGLQGTIGIIGPKRMDYENVMGKLKAMMDQLDDVFHK